MRIMQVILLIIIFLFLTFPVSALTKSYDPNTQTISIKNDAGTITYVTIQQISKVSELTYFQDVFEIKSYIDYTLDPTKDFIHRWQQIIGKNGIYKHIWEIYNGGEWKPFSPIGKTLTAGNTYTIRLTLYKKAETGSFKILSIPVFGNLELPEMTWWNGSWDYRIDNVLSDDVRPYQYSINISNSTGVNNATHVFCNGYCNVGFTDIRFILDNTTELPYWIEDNTTGKVWVNATANGTVNMYYGNPSATSVSNGTNTFAFFDSATGTYGDKWTTISGVGGSYTTQNGRNVIAVTGSGGIGAIVRSLTYQTGDNIIIEADVKVTGNLAAMGFFQTSTPTWMSRYYGFVDVRVGMSELLFKDGTAIGTYSNVFSSANTWTTWKVIAGAGSLKNYVGGVLGGSATDSTYNSGYLTFEQYEGTGYYANYRIRKYASPEPVWAIWGSEESQPPTYSNVSHNQTIAGLPTLFSIQYNDEIALHPTGQWIFATNNTGNWVNESAVNWTATPEWANVTKTLNSTVGTVIGYRWYANDSVGNVNNTPIYTLTVNELILSGYVHNILSSPIEDARVEYTGSDGSYSFTDAAGYYSITIPAGADRQILSRAIGYMNSTNTSTINEDTTMNFTLEEKEWATSNDTGAAGTMGFIGGIIGGVIALSALKKYWRA